MVVNSWILMFAWRTFTVEEFVLHLTRGVKVQSILFVINTLGAGGGGEKALLELLSQMDLDKYEVHLQLKSKDNSYRMKWNIKDSDLK